MKREFPKYRLTVDHRSKMAAERVLTSWESMKEFTHIMVRDSQKRLAKKLKEYSKLMLTYRLPANIQDAIMLALKNPNPVMPFRYELGSANKGEFRVRWEYFWALVEYMNSEDRQRVSAILAADAQQISAMAKQKPAADSMPAKTTAAVKSFGGRARRARQDMDKPDTRANLGAGFEEVTSEKPADLATASLGKAAQFKFSARVLEAFSRLTPDQRLAVAAELERGALALRYSQQPPISRIQFHVPSITHN